MAASMMLPGKGNSQALPQTKTLIVQGDSEEAPVIEIRGRAYVELGALTRLLKGSLSFEHNHILLVLPFMLASSPVTSSPTRSSLDSELSKDFLKSVIEEMTLIRGWQISLTTAVQRGYPITEEWAESFRSQTQEALLLASLDASTESDQSAIQLLVNEFNNMKNLSWKFVEANKSMTYLFPSILQEDPLYQRIVDCAHSLAAMATRGEFTDDGSCR
jgi:hypothetical protein